MWLITKNIKIGLMFSFTELIFKPIIYFLHERIWYKWIKFGIIKKIPIKGIFFIYFLIDVL